MLPLTPSDAETLKTATGLLLWAGKQIKVWIEARRADRETNPKAKPPTIGKAKKPRDVAIVVRISRLAVEDVHAYLKQRKLDADVIVISNSDSDEVIHLPNKAEVWEELVREFYTAFTKVQAEFGAQRFHIFVSAPSALTFAMGCTMSTLYDVHLYQWDLENHTYVEVIRGTSRERLMKVVKGRKV